jgi:DNA-directed RNA polymerase subunit N (RpoN/RPB10)
MSIKKIAVRCLGCGKVWYQRIDFKNHRVEFYAGFFCPDVPVSCLPIKCPGCGKILGCKIPYGTIKTKYE